MAVRQHQLQTTFDAIARCRCIVQNERESRPIVDQLQNMYTCTARTIRLLNGMLYDISTPDTVTTDEQPCSYLLMDVDNAQIMYLVMPIQGYRHSEHNRPGLLPSTVMNNLRRILTAKCPGWNGVLHPSLVDDRGGLIPIVCTKEKHTDDGALQIQTEE